MGNLTTPSTLLTMWDFTMSPPTMVTLCSKNVAMMPLTLDIFNKDSRASCHVGWIYNLEIWKNLSTGVLDWFQHLHDVDIG